MCCFYFAQHNSHNVNSSVFFQNDVSQVSSGA